MQGEKCEMRTKQALKNTISSLLLEVVVAISGLIVPRIFTAAYGSSVNGLVSSISQFITYMSLVEAGIGAAGTVSLYSPLAQKDKQSINEIVSAARIFYIKSGCIFVALVLILTFFYPYIVHGEICDVTFIRTMILVLSVSGITDYFILGKYRVILQADQKYYVISIAQIIGTIIVMFSSIILIKINVSALLVKTTASFVYFLRSLAVAAYFKKNYPEVSFKVSPNMEAFSQRWSALLHQVVAMIVNNTDIILLTVMLPQNALAEVSVYSVYNLVGYALSSLLNSICNGVRPSFGQVISRNENDVLHRSFNFFEYVMFMLIFLCYVCMGVLIFPFVKLYSLDFTDGVTYARWSVAILFTFMGVIQSVRLPDSMIIVAAGHYKQTQWRALIEAIINLGVSIILVKPLGIVGVLIGTCASYLYRSTDVIFYASKYLITGTRKTTFKRLLRNVVISAVLNFLGFLLIPAQMNSWITWILYAVLFFLGTAVVIIGVNFIAEPSQYCECVRYIKKFVSKIKHQ